MINKTVLNTLKVLSVIFLLVVSKPGLAQYDTLHYLPPVFVSNAIKTSNNSCRDHYLILSTNESNTFLVSISRGDGLTFADYSILTGSQSATGVFNLSRSTPLKLKFNNTGFNTEHIFSENSLNTALDTGGYKLQGAKPFFANIRHIAGAQGASLTCKGTTALGTNFFAGFQAAGTGTHNVDNQHSHFIAVMATLNNTNITINNFNPGVTFIGKASSGSPATANTITFSLNAGQSYIIAQTRDQMSVDMDEYNGIRIISDKDIVVNTGSWTGPANSGGSRDIGIDQLIPAKFAGNKYALIRGKNTTNGAGSVEKFIAVTTQPGITIITSGAGASDTIFGQGNYKTLTGTGYWNAASSVAANSSNHSNMAFTSTQPILIYQTLFGNSNKTTSSMNLIPPLAECIGSDSIYIHDPEQFGSNSVVTIASPITSTIKIEDEAGNTLLTVLPSAENLPGTVITDFRTTVYDIPNSVTDILVTSDEKVTVGFLGASTNIGGAGYMSAFSDRSVEYSTSDPLFIGNGRARLDLCEGNPAYISIDDSESYSSFQWYRNNTLITGESNDSLQVVTEGDYKAIATYCSLPLESTLIFVDEFGSPGKQGFKKIVALFESETFDGFTSEANIADWDEQSKDFNNASIVSNGPSVSTNEFNLPGFHPIPRFEARDSEYLKSMNDLSNIDGSNHYSFFIVLKDSNTTSGHAVMNFENSSSGPRIIKNTNGYRFAQGVTATGGPITADVTTDTDKFIILACVSDGTTVELFANGKKGPVNFGNTTSNTLDVGGHLIIGGDEEGSGKYFNGFIAEFILFDTTLNANERQIVETYYGVKYGITFNPINDETGINDGDYISNNGSVVWDYSANSTYHNCVVGIGLDECGRLRQWQNKDANGGDVVTIGIGEISSTVGSNPNYFTVDNTYFLWGRNTEAFDSKDETDFGTTLNAEVIETRVARTWKTQETGNVGSLRIQFDLKTGGNETAIYNLEEVRLLVDTDDVFSAGAISIAPTSFNSATGIINFDHDFQTSTGFYFSLGSVNAISTPLPISLVSFDANLTEGKNVLCDWVCDSENNNDYFTIEKSRDGLNWLNVGYINGAGNSSATLSYQLVDANPFYGLSYYRLSQTDFDGTTKQVGVKSVYLDDKTIASINIYPNPAKQSFSILSNQHISGVMNIYSGTGQLVKTQRLVDAQNTRINIENLGKGVYYVNINYSNINEVLKLVVD